MQTFIFVRVATLSLLTSAVVNAAEPLKVVQTIPLPGVQGRFDHLAIDLKGEQLFVAAKGNNTVEVIDLSAGKVRAQIHDVPEPQGVAFLPESNQIAVAVSKDGSCRFYDAKSLTLVKKIESVEDADNVRYDAPANRLYLAYGDGSIAAIDTVNLTKLSEVKLKGHPESFQLENKGTRIFANVPDAEQIVIIDREKMKAIAEWPMRDIKENFTMAFDEKHDRLFIGCRKPARLLVLDTSGKTIATTAMAGDGDAIFVDHKLHRVYSSCGEGFLDVFDASKPDKYPRIAHIPTLEGARTCLFVPQSKRLYLAVPQHEKEPAEIRVFKTQD